VLATAVQLALFLTPLSDLEVAVTVMPSVAPFSAPSGMTTVSVAYFVLFAAIDKV